MCDGIGAPGWGKEYLPTFRHNSLRSIFGSFRDQTVYKRVTKISYKSTRIAGQTLAKTEALEGGCDRGRRDCGCCLVSVLVALSGLMRSRGAKRGGSFLKNSQIRYMCVSSQWPGQFKTSRVTNSWQLKRFQKKVEEGRGDIGGRRFADQFWGLGKALHQSG